MKFSFVVLAITISVSAFSQTDPQKCYTTQNKIDRKYCLDKYLESVELKLAADKKAWGASLAPATKEEKAAALKASIESKKDQLSIVSSEIALFEKQMAELTAVPAATAAAPKKKEKKKPKFPFGIKL